MIEESGRVVAVEAGAVWVETLRKSTCSSCSMSAGCGQGVLDRLGVGGRRGHVRALSDLSLSVGDAVVIGVREDLLVRGSLLVYLVPLMGLFAAALAAERLALSEPVVVLCALAGLALAALGVRWRSARTAGDPALQPVVLRALIAGDVPVS
ncbi:SoxR reducing system RseC family protein [Pseudomonas lalucatii]|uniref:SoxR reducing system RseC family protein n=1 Tax=Pseudomonas lalucatii TaxID=1424203 RepID=A0ABS5PYF5_9PSED|nr:SoxR reducing system RseC family protein [Pseudomonas lalucatii]